MKATLLRTAVASVLLGAALSAHAFLISTAGDTTGAGVITTTDYKYSNLAGINAATYTYGTTFDVVTGAFAATFTDGANVLSVANPAGSVSNSNDTYSFSGTWTKGATTTVDVMTTGTYSATFDLNSQRYIFSLSGTNNPVPEPATLAALGLGAAALLRRKRAR